jgi:hypothetical protein
MENKTGLSSLHSGNDYSQYSGRATIDVPFKHVTDERMNIYTSPNSITRFLSKEGGRKYRSVKRSARKISRRKTRKNSSRGGRKITRRRKTIRCRKTHRRRKTVRR